MTEPRKCSEPGCGQKMKRVWVFKPGIPIPKLEWVCDQSDQEHELAALEAVVQRVREKARAPFSIDQTAWLVERNLTPDGQEYLFVDKRGVLGWTTNNLKALRLSRKVDAESVVSIVEDAVRVAEHAWINSLPVDKKD